MGQTGQLGHPRVGLMLALEPDFLVAALPLFERDEVDALSLSVDFAWMRSMPDWARALVREYGDAGALFGHAIHYSTLSALSTSPQPSANHRWLEDLRRSGATRGLRLLSAHFGLSIVPGYERGAPLPVPYGAAALRAGRRWMGELARAADVAIGLENLALAFSTEDVLEQGRFIDELIEPVAGFVTLDVHNVHCQAVNFDLDPYEILATYPLSRVRELHVSGGSVGRSGAEPDREVRQDTHDGDVPAAVIELAEWVIARAPALEAVFLERLGGTIGQGEDSVRRLGADYAALRSAVARAAPASVSPRPSGEAALVAVDDSADALEEYACLLVRTLGQGLDPREAQRRLVEEAPPGYRARTSRALPRMLDLGGAVVREWYREGRT